MTHAPILQANKLCLDAPGGRPLLRDLDLSLGRERVALIGRNGAGKSSLLTVLAGTEEPTQGRVTRTGRTLLVSQDLPEAGGIPMSPGERRRRALEAALQQLPDLLLLDEPTRDLDADGVAWLVAQLQAWHDGLIVVTHDRRVLRHFNQFFVVAESGCWAFAGDFDELLRDMERNDADNERKYARDLGRLLDKEQHTATVQSRRARKKNVGRVRELGRCTSRCLLNSKRSYKQVSQGKRAGLQRDRITAMRQWVHGARRALSVSLPLEAVLPALPEDSGQPLSVLKAVSARAADRELFSNIDLTLGRRRIAVTGPNGSGKSTLLNLVVRELEPETGQVRSALDRIGFIAQHAANWCSPESLLDRLVTGADAVSVERAAELLAGHKFPLALARRPFDSLSPGERLRAALICLLQRRPVVELLVLDEPSDDLDLQATLALEALLRAWPGGLLIASHDPEFLRGIGVDEEIRLGGSAPRWAVGCR